MTMKNLSTVEFVILWWFQENTLFSLLTTVRIKMWMDEGMTRTPLNLSRGSFPPFVFANNVLDWRYMCFNSRM